MQSNPSQGSLGTLSRLRSSLKGGLLILATCSLLIALGTMLMEALSRLFFDTSFFWAEELVRFAIIATAFLSLSLAGAHQRHIRAELFVSLMPTKLRQVLNMIAVLAGLGYSGILAWTGWTQATQVFRIRLLSESVLELPMWIVAAAVPIGATLLAFYYFGRFRAILGGDSDPLGETQSAEDMT